MSTFCISVQHSDNPIVFVKHVPFAASSEELYGLFGRFGAVRQVRVGNTDNTKGTCIVVYETAQEAKLAVNKLNGYNFGSRYLVALPYVSERTKNLNEDLETRKANLEKLKREHNIE